MLRAGCRDVSEFARLKPRHVRSQSDDCGALQIESAGMVVSVWRREADVFHSTGSAREQQLGSRRQPILAAAPRGPVLAWTKGKELKVETTGAGQCGTLDGEAAYPSMIPLPNGPVALALEQNGDIVVRALGLNHDAVRVGESGVNSSSPSRMWRTR